MSRAGPAFHAARAARLGVALLALVGAGCSAGRTVEGTVVRVTDGDTVMFKPDVQGEKPFKLRLEGIDAPEICQPGGVEAREALSARVLNKHVQATTNTVNSSGLKRALAFIGAGFRVRVPWRSGGQCGTRRAL